MGGGYDPSHTAGTAQIAADTGGDTMRVDDAGSLQDTLSRLRQRYALYFYLPEGSKGAEDRNIQVDLAQNARIRYSQAEIRYRHTSMSGNGNENAAGPALVTHAPVNAPLADEPTLAAPQAPAGRRAAVNEDSSPHVNLSTDGDENGAQPSTSTASQQTSSGWPRSTPPGKNPPQ